MHLQRATAVQATQTMTALDTPMPVVIHLSLCPERAQLRESPKQTVLSTLLKLGAILVKHGNKKDLLSINLMVAGHTFMAYVVANIRRPVNELLKGGIEKIEMIKSMLKNPYGIHMFQNPWLVENAVTLEEESYKQFKE